MMDVVATAKAWRMSWRIGCRVIPSISGAERDEAGLLAAEQPLRPISAWHQVVALGHGKYVS